MHFFKITYELDDGCKINIQSRDCEDTKYCLGDIYEYSLLVDGEFINKKGVIIKILQEIEKIDEFYSLTVNL